MPDPHLERFARLAARDPQHVRLDLAALEIARIGHPDLDPSLPLAELDELAQRATARRCSDEGAMGSVGLLCRSLFSEEGFQGDRDQYYDPRNSYLNDVLDRRVGIPITLSVVFLEVARRLGIPAEGVAFPGHFLIRAHLEGQQWLLDPFRRGALVTPEDCRSLAEQALGADASVLPRFLEPVGPHAILARMLRNLKGIFRARQDDARGEAVMERLVLLEPENWPERRDRGKLRLARNKLLGAAGDLEAYLNHAGDAEDTDEVLGLLVQLRSRQAMSN